MSERIVQIVTEVNEKSGGHNGITIPRLLEMLDKNYDEVKQVLRDLYKEKKIIVRDGIRGKLIFLNKRK